MEQGEDSKVGGTIEWCEAVGRAQVGFTTGYEASPII